MDDLYLVCVIVLAVLGIVGALHPAFDDTLIQRAGLALLTFGAAAEATSLIQSAAAAPNARVLLVLGCAVYGVGCAIKTLHYRSKR
jgi:hypothetical protein